MSSDALNPKWLGVRAVVVASFVVVVAAAIGLSGCSRDSGSPGRPNPTEASATADPTMVALQAALDGEYAASYAYGVIGGRLTSATDQAAALAALTTHDNLRDQLRTDITALAGQPRVPAPGYRLPFAVQTPAQARLLAVDVETKAAALWRQVADHATGATQQAASAAADGCQQRAAKWSKPSG